MNRTELNRQFCNDIWATLNDTQKKNLMREVIQDEKQQLSNMIYNNSLPPESSFAYHPISLSIKELEHSKGKSSRYSIIIDKDLLGDGELTYTTLMHETYHIFQMHLMDKSRIFFADNKLKEYVDSLKISTCTKTNVTIYDTNTHQPLIVNGSLYINNINDTFKDGFEHSNTKILSEMFYKLRRMEREAFQYAFNQKQKFNKDIIRNYKINFKLSNPTNDIQEQIDIFKKAYHCSHLSNDDIIKTIDNCYENIYYHKQPNTDLEKLVMYDISCIAALYCGNLYKDNCLLLMQYEQKSKNLDIDIPYINQSIINSEDPDIIKDYTIFDYFPQKYNEFSEEKQVKNTKLAIYIASNSINKKDLNFKNKEAIRTYCMNNIPLIIDEKYSKSGISNLFEVEFYETLKYCNENLNGVAINNELYELMKTQMYTNNQNLEQYTTHDSTFNNKETNTDFNLNIQNKKDDEIEIT